MVILLFCFSFSSKAFSCSEPPRCSGSLVPAPRLAKGKTLCPASAPPPMVSSLEFIVLIHLSLSSPHHDPASWIHVEPFASFARRSIRSPTADVSSSAGIALATSAPSPTLSWLSVPSYPPTGVPAPSPPPGVSSSPLASSSPNALVAVIPWWRCL